MDSDSMGSIFREEESFARSIRKFFRELFGSRLVERLEEDLLRLRNDMDQRLLDKDEIITNLRAEKTEMQGKIILYERSIMPTSSRAGADIVARQKPKQPNWSADFKQPPPVKTRWQLVQEEHDKRLAAEEEEEKSKTVEQTA